jgi:hypothetical protein
MDVVDNNDSPTGPDPQARLGRDGREKSAQPIPYPIISSKSYTDESLEESLLTGESDTMVGVATSGEPEPGEWRSMTPIKLDGCLKTRSRGRPRKDLSRKQATPPPRTVV